MLTKKTRAVPAILKESKNIWIVGDSIASDHDIDEANEVQITGWGMSCSSWFLMMLL